MPAWYSGPKMGAKEMASAERAGSLSLGRVEMRLAKLVTIFNQCRRMGWGTLGLN